VSSVSTKTEVDQKDVFRAEAQKISHKMLVSWVGEERANVAAGRLAVALVSAGASAKKPEDFYSCSIESVANVIAISALTGIMVGQNVSALAYAIPRKIKDKWQLGYQLSHRGINALASRSGRTMIPIPIGKNDEISIDEDFNIQLVNVDLDNPPTTYEDLRGVVVLIKDLQTARNIHRAYVPKKIIDIRRDDSDAYQFAMKNDWARERCPWFKYGVEMAMKAAMHYSVARGWCVIDDMDAIRAVSMDVEADSISMAQENQPKRLEALYADYREKSSTTTPEAAPESKPDPQPEAKEMTHGELETILKMSRTRMAVLKSAKALTDQHPKLADVIDKLAKQVADAIPDEAADMESRKERWKHTLARTKSEKQLVALEKSVHDWIANSGLSEDDQIEWGTLFDDLASEKREELGE